MRATRILLSTGAAAGILVGLAAAMESCVLPEFAVGSPPDAGSDAPPDTGPPACVGKTYPDPPAGGDMPINNTIVMAVHAIDMGEGATEPPGYDLDHQCTCFNDAGPTCVPRVQQCDAPGGVDNTAAKLINLVTFAAGSNAFGSGYFSAQANAGSWSLLIEVQNYSGLPDDPSVDVALYPSPGVGVGNPMPKWDGTDQWPLSASAVDTSMKPLYTSQGAYVANNVLVAAVPSVALTISGGTQTITIRLSGGVITGTLQPAPGGYRIVDGILAARWYEPDIFAALSSYRDNDGKPICTDAAISYGTAKTVICNNLDILKDGSGAKSLPCDSLSMGIGFKADPAMLGAVTQPPAPTPGCPPNTDPAMDDCNK